MMKLRSAPPSPFGRKVKIAAYVLGLGDQIETITSDTNDAADALRNDNPLGKIPCLVLADGTAIYDSRVIVDYLDHLAGGNKIIPLAPQARIASLTLQALGDGMMDAGIMMIYEQRWRAEAMRDAKWVGHHQGKIDRALAVLEAAPPSGPVDIGHIAVACALGYLDLRFSGTWRAHYPAMVKWLDHFAAQVPSFEKTRLIQP